MGVLHEGKKGGRGDGDQAYTLNRGPAGEQDLFRREWSVLPGDEQLPASGIVA